MNHPETTEQFDAIIIGSGMGGLTVASLLAQLGKKRVLILERHFKLGGFTHSFRRGKFEWDVGVHYVGEMYPKALSRKVMDLVTGKAVDWQPGGPIIERYHFPEGNFEVPSDPKLFQKSLCEKFPDEAAEINRYFKDLKSCQLWFARWCMSKYLPKWLGRLLVWPGKKLAMTITADYMKRFRSQHLKGILTGQWPDFGAPPEKSAMAFHSAVASDFLKGSYYPIGGAQCISDSVEVIVEKHGGKCLVNRDVSEIIVEGGRAVGVRASHKGAVVTYRAPIIVSNANAGVTFGKLVPKDYCAEEKSKVARLKAGVSALILFLGLKDDPRKHGFDDANYWLYSSSNHDLASQQSDPRMIEGGFLSFGSLRDPAAKSHVAQIIGFSQYDYWREYATKRWKRRGEDYESIKEEIANHMIERAEQFMPGIKELVEYKELATPVTVETFANHPQGMIYGQLCDADRVEKDSWRISTSLPGLYLAGSDVGSPGVNGAMMASLFTAVKLLGPFGLVKVFSRL